MRVARVARRTAWAVVVMAVVAAWVAAWVTALRFPAATTGTWARAGGRPGFAVSVPHATNSSARPTRAPSIPSGRASCSLKKRLLRGFLSDFCVAKNEHPSRSIAANLGSILCSGLSLDGPNGEVKKRHLPFSLKINLEKQKAVYTSPLRGRLCQNPAKGRTRAANCHSQIKGPDAGFRVGATEDDRPKKGYVLCGFGAWPGLVGLY